MAEPRRPAEYNKLPVEMNTQLREAQDFLVKKTKK